MHALIKLFFILFFLLTYVVSSAQSKNDYVWLTGRGSKKNILDFNSGSVIITESELSLGIMGDNASYCDDNGNLICYSNGFAIANANHEIFMNGDSLSSDDKFFLNGNLSENGRIGVQDLLILPEPFSDSTFYIIHKPRFFNDENDLKAGYLLYSFLDLNANSGQGEVIEKNIEFFFDEYLLGSYLTAIHHANAEDWWIIDLKETENEYFTFLLDSTGISLIHSQEIGGDRFYDAASSGTAKFSSDGTKYCHFNYGDQLWIYDFDRETGLLSNADEIIINDTLPQVFSSVEWSANSRFIYVACKFYLYQIDTWNNNEVELISEWSGLSDPFANTYWLMVQGPDCRIYLRSTNGTDSWHVIHYPDEKGQECGFQEASVRPPNGGTFGNWPNHPRWRVDEEEKCDPSIISMLGQPVYYVEQIKIYPNPAQNFIKLELPSIGKGEIEIYNTNGQLKEKRKWDSTNNETISLLHFPSGMYFLEFIPLDNPKRKVYQGKIIKQ